MSTELTEEEYEQEFELTRQYELGQGDGILHAAGIVMGKGIEAFKRNDDEESHKLKSLWNELYEIGNELLEKTRKKKYVKSQ